MEEILASIRRIIADDQPLGAPPPHEPATALPGLPAPDKTAPDAAAAREAGATDAGPSAATPELPPGHGTVAAPQFVSPEGPAGIAETRHPLAPQPPSSPAAAAEPAAESGRHVAVPDQDPHETALKAMHDDVDVLSAVHALHEDTLYEAVAEEPPMNLREPPIPPRDKPEEPAAAGLFSAATSQSLASAFNTLAVSRLADDSQELRGLARDMLRPLLKDWLDEHLPGLVESIIREEIDRMSRRTR